MKNSYHLALSIAYTVHNKQVDLSGKPYINHPLHVAASVKGKKAKIVALLHDTVEDGNITIDYLKKYFTDDICDAVDHLTRKPNVSYETYIENIKECKLARIVKIKDLEHNMDLTRLNKLDDKDYQRLAKYMNAYWRLKYE